MIKPSSQILPIGQGVPMSSLKEFMIGFTMVYHGALSILHLGIFQKHGTLVNTKMSK